MERIIVSAIQDYLDQNNILSPSQFGFSAGRSVQDQLILTYNTITHEYDLGNIVELVLFDFKKAFELVPHNILMDKLLLLGFQDPLLGWIGDFLCGRTMRAVVSGSQSSSRPVRSGVPQGSVIGPLLFVIFVNHLIHDLNSHTNLFADDLKLFAGIQRDLPSYINGISSIQSDIDKLEARAKSWGLEFAAHKCIRLRFARPFANIPPPLPQQ